MLLLASIILRFIINESRRPTDPAAWWILAAQRGLTSCAKAATFRKVRFWPGVYSTNIARVPFPGKHDWFKEPSVFLHLMAAVVQDGSTMQIFRRCQSLVDLFLFRLRLPFLFFSSSGSSENQCGDAEVATHGWCGVVSKSILFLLLDLS